MRGRQNLSDSNMVVEISEQILNHAQYFEEGKRRLNWLVDVQVLLTEANDVAKESNEALQTF